MKVSKSWLQAIVIGLGLLAANAFAGNYFDQVSGGTLHSSSSSLSVPSGALVEWAALASDPDGSAGVWITGAGVNVYQSASAGQYIDDYTYTTSSGTLGYQIWAQGGYPEASSALISVSW